jgi:hypothetical protein
MTEPVVIIRAIVKVGDVVLVKDNRNNTDEIAGKVVEVTHNAEGKRFSILLDTGYTIEFGSE